MPVSAFDQHGADVRFDWGPQGLESLLAGGVATVVLVDVLRFTTAVDVACGRGAAVTPFADDDGGEADAEAARRGATLAANAAGGDTSRPSLSPVSLRNLTAADHVLLRSPNGSLRPAVEDAWGAGAVIRALSPSTNPDPTMGLFAMFGESIGGAPQAPPARRRSLSPEAAWAATDLPVDLPKLLPLTASGRELEEAGWSLDIEVAAALDVSSAAPKLDKDGTFRA